MGKEAATAKQISLSFFTHSLALSSLPQIAGVCVWEQSQCQNCCQGHGGCSELRPLWEAGKQREKLKLRRKVEKKLLPAGKTIKGIGKLWAPYPPDFDSHKYGIFLVIPRTCAVTADWHALSCKFALSPDFALAFSWTTTKPAKLLSLGLCPAQPYGCPAANVSHACECKYAPCSQFVSLCRVVFAFGFASPFPFHPAGMRHLRWGGGGQGGGARNN